MQWNHLLGSVFPTDFKHLSERQHFSIILDPIAPNKCLLNWTELLRTLRSREVPSKNLEKTREGCLRPVKPVIPSYCTWSATAEQKPKWFADARLKRFWASAMLIPDDLMKSQGHRPGGWWTSQSWNLISCAASSEKHKAEAGLNLAAERAARKGPMENPTQDFSPPSAPSLCSPSQPPSKD